MNTEQIAQVAHELNKAYCEAIGDNSQPDWENAPEWQKKSAITGVEFHIANPDASPAASHESWMKEKEADGWKYGPVKDPEKKEHPCYVPYEELPVEQRAKDYIFRQTVHSLSLFLPGHLSSLFYIAKVTEQILCAVDEAYGGPAIVPDWENRSKNDQNMLMEQVLMFQENPELPVSAVYDKWYNDALAAGWTKGEIHDNDKKTLPDLIPFDELSQDMKIQHALFKQVVLSLRNQALNSDTPQNAVISENIQIPDSQPEKLEKDTKSDLPFETLSFGQRAVRPKNGGNPEDIEKITNLYGQIIDILNGMRTKSASGDQKRHLSTAITDTETAKMRAICGVTWQD